MLKIPTRLQHTAQGLFCSVAVLLVVPATTALAQEGIEEIIVTARQRAESLQDVPAAITAFTQSDLERAGVERAEDFIRLTPGVSMVNAAEVGDTQVNIRGINGARDAENSFAFIVDGVLMTNPAAFNREYADLQQIEIVKGPQGAIYGRNAAAGAIIVTTQKPSDEFEATVSGSVAGDATYVVSGTVSGPMSDSSYYSLHADIRSSDGYYSNVFTGGSSTVDDFESTNITGRLLFDVSDDLTIDVKGRYGKVDAASISFNAAFALPTFGLFVDPLFFEDVNAHQFDFTNNIDPQNDQDALEFSIKADWEQEWGTVTAWALYSDIENSLSADGTSGAFGFFNADQECIDTVANQFAAGVTFPRPQFLGPDPASSVFGPYTSTACDGTQYQERNQTDYSFELRVASPSDQALRWLAGVYYLNIDRQVGVNQGVDLGNGVVSSLYAGAFGSSPNPTEQLVHDDFGTDVIAVFGSLAYDLSDNLELAIAARYDQEDRTVSSLVPTAARSQYIDFDLSNPAYTGGAPLNPGLDPNFNPNVLPNGSIPSKSETWEEFEPKVSVTWGATEDLTIFGSWGVGFKSGGFNNQGAQATVDLFINNLIGFFTGGAGQPANQAPVGIQDRFAKETSSAFELGFKSSLADGRVQLEAAVFDNTVDDMQFFEFLVGPFGLLRIVENIDEVELQGFEIGLQARVTDNFTLGLGYAATDSEITANTVRSDTVGNDAPYTPEFTANVNLELDLPLSGDRSFVAGAYWSFIGDTWFHVIQAQERTTLFDVFFPGLGTANYSLTKRDAYDTLNLRLGIEADNWSVTVFGNNITDEKYLEEVIPAPEFGGSFIHPGSLARWGIEASYRF